jgi:hypothetical protein
VALRIKCKCGKSLKISSKLADKKLQCPGCGKPFRIPAEKFRQAAGRARAAATQSATVKQPRAATRPKTTAETPVAMPAELDILPANLDLPGDFSASQSDVLTDMIPTAQPAAGSPAGKAGLACPLCQKTLPPGAVICVDCGFNAATGAYLQNSVPPTAAPVAAAQTAGYAADGTRVFIGGSHLSMDAIQGPQRSFWADAFRSFGYPFISANNGIVFGMVVFAECMGVLLSWAFPLAPCFVGPVLLIAFISIRGWIASVLLSVIQDTASGSEELPGIKIQDGAMEDVIKPLLKYIGAGACALLPACIYLILMVSGSLPGTLASGLNLALLVGAGIFVWPIFLMLFAFGAPAQIFRVDLIVTTIFRTFLPYLGLWLMLLLASFDMVLLLLAEVVARTSLNITVPQVPQIPGMAGNMIYSAVSLYLSIVSMRLIGLYYLHFKKRFTFVME